jgi:hypothetical protein
MTFDWYQVFNLDEFEATGLVSRELTLILQGIGSKTFLITHGDLTSLTVDDTMLSIGLTDDNPFVFNSRAVYVDQNRDVWFGILKP